MMKTFMEINKILIRLTVVTVINLSVFLQTAHGGDTWRTDFDTACAQSNNAMTLSIPELKKLIELCDQLQNIINGQDETVRKVFLKRLQLCRNLYVFVLEAKTQEQGPK